ncbi:transporter substrate-binding domain-containing protein [Photobacterium rosenbergii]|uniref:transporter substrate-binding domain-containing protein n=1 Tax=Photobacterium rosenbergii TaxID=294936 RepID=UPI001C991057|nr:transporter substrate-binding domain-containing protein [Photobacterium rosenbergii]MBY5943758.1 transporter substrate-binding domain-containing protein [Photobacterium rosenbergii]
MQPKTLARYFSFILLACWVALTSLSTVASQEPTIAQKTQVRVGFPGFNLPPYIFVSPTLEQNITAEGYVASPDSYSGLLMDVLKQVSHHAEFDYQVVFYPTFEDVTNAFKAGELDLLAGVTSTSNRQGYMSFSEPIFSLRRGVVTLNKPINHYQELDSEVIAIEQGFALQELLPTILPWAQLRPVPDSEVAINSILQQQAKGYIGDAVVLSNLIKQLGDSQLTLSILPDLPTNHLHFSTPKGKHRLLNRINFALEDIKAGSIKSIYNQWLTPDQLNMFAQYGHLNLSQEERSWLEANPTITVGVHRDWAPYDFISEQSHHSGLTADLLKIIANELGVKFEVVSKPSYEALREAFINGDIMMLSALTETPEDALQMHFSAPYVDEPWVLFGNADPALTQLLSQGTSQVGTISGTAGESLLATLCLDCEMQSFPDQDSAFRALQSKQVDLVLTSLHHASPLLQSDYIGQFRMQGQILPDNLLPLSFAINYRHPILLNIINKALASIPSEEYSRLEHQWLTFDYQEGLAPLEVAKWAGLISTLGIVVIASIIGWNRKMAKEILQRKAAELRAKKAEQRLQHLADNLDGIVLQHIQPDPAKPLQFQFTFVSASINELLQVSAEQLFRSPETLLDKMAIENIQELEQSMLNACHQGHWDHEQAIASSSPTPMWVQFKSRITPHEEKGFYWNTVITDISLLKQQQLALDTARQKAESATEAKSQFLATISHEVRTPISGILGLLELMADQPLNEETKNLHGGLTQSARNMLHIVNDVLDFSKIEAGKLDLNPEQVELGTVLARIIQPQSIHAQQKSLAFHYWQDPRLAQCHLVDDIRLQQILNNFLNNAIKFTQQGTISLAVDIMATKEEFAGQDCQHIRFSVKDTGIGIPKDKQLALFQPFAQADQTTSRRFGGTGLGLAIAHKLIEQMDGTVALSSEEGKGSTFSITLPLPVLSHEQGTSSPAFHTQTANVFGYFIQREELCRYLEHLGLSTELTTLDNPSTVCNKIARVKPDFAFLTLSLWQQLKLPTAWFEQNAPTTKVIIINQNPMLSPEPMDEHWCLSVNPLFPDNLRHVMTQRVAPLVQHPESPVTQVVMEGREHAEMSGQLILVAEDHPINQQVIGKQLEKLGVVADIVDNGVQALQALEQNRYGLLLSDCHMPEMDGYTLATTVRQKEQHARELYTQFEQYDETNEQRAARLASTVGSSFAHSCLAEGLPIIALTANAVQGEDGRCFAAGMSDFIVKPVSIEQLSTLIEKWLPPKTAETKLHPALETEVTINADSDILADDFGALFGGITASLDTAEENTEEPNELISFADDDLEINSESETNNTLGEQQGINSPRKPSGTDYLFDREKLIAMFDDHALTEQLIVEFKETHHRDLLLLEAALAQHDQLQAADIAHRMKGASKMLECEALAQPLAEIERYASAENIEQAQPAIDKLRTLSEHL